MTNNRKPYIKALTSDSKVLFEVQFDIYGEIYTINIYTSGTDSNFDYVWSSKGDIGSEKSLLGTTTPASKSTKTTSSSSYTKTSPSTYTLQTPHPIYGTIEITSDPFDATIKLDGKVVGTTPWQSNEVLVGKHMLTLEKEGYNTRCDTITMKQGGVISIHRTLWKTSKKTREEELKELHDSLYNIHYKDVEKFIGEIVEETNDTYQVGDYYNENGKEGVVFWVDGTGKHGKIISMTYSKGMAWSSDTNEQKRLIGANSETDGAKNMQAVKRIIGWQSKYPAFKCCADLGEGWYLPAKGELLTIYKRLDAINRTLVQKGAAKLGSFLWSSTESSYKSSSTSILSAYAVNVFTGGVNSNYKSGGNYVRAVAVF